MRLINADHLDALILAIERGSDRSFIARTLKGIINAAPTVDAEPVIHAKLLNPNPCGECSNCGYLIDIRQGFNYCPNCGAKMEREEESWQIPKKRNL